MKRMSRINRLIAICALAMAILAGLPVVGAANEITIALVGDGDHLDPHRPPGNGVHAMMHIYDGLTALTADGELIPALAESWRALNDLTWEFTIRRGVRFHNGESLDAHVVARNFERVLDPNQPRASYNFHIISSVEVTDDYTVVVHTKVPDSLFPYRMQGLFIGPASMMDNPEPDDFNRHPVGTGPFRFVRWDRGEQLVLEANPDYWRGRPALDRIIMRSIPEAATRIAELLAGGVDVVEGLAPEQISLVERSGRARVVSRPSMINNFVTFNTLKDGPLADRRVRQAINHAVDVETIIAALLDGTAHRHATIFHPQVLGYNANIKPYEYDPARARALLESAGYGNGFTLELGVNESIAGTGAIEVAQAIANQLGQVGIRVQLRNIEYGAMRQMVLVDRTPPDMFMWIWKTWFQHPDELLTGVIHSNGIASYYSNPVVDSLIDRARATLDRDVQAELYSRIQEFLWGDAPLLFLYYGSDIYGISPHLNWEPREDARLYFYEASLQ